MELPNYRLPGLKCKPAFMGKRLRIFCRGLYRNSGSYGGCVVLQSFDFQFNLVEDSSGSILAVISGWLAPLFAPLGLGTGGSLPLLSAALWQKRAWYLLWKSSLQAG